MEHRSLDPQLVSEQILWLRRDVVSTPMHAIKLVYLCHGWMLGLKDKSLIHEPVEAWTYGPVVPSVYYRYKAFGGFTITSEAVNKTSDFTDEQNKIVKEVVDVYMDSTAIELSNITHKTGTPWDLVMRKYGGVGSIIPNEIIRDHYRQLIKYSEMR